MASDRSAGAARRPLRRLDRGASVLPAGHLFRRPDQHHVPVYEGNPLCVSGSWRARRGTLMRDPDLVLRAEQAAAVLERAWSQWRALRGSGAGALPPVSSYVGYSLDEPWGQPRVVFGLAAEEAEQLAALI